MSTLPVVVTARNVSGLTTTGNATINVTDVAPVSLFTTQTPAQPNSTEPGPQDYELGMRFSSSVNGTITGIRYWRAASETGTHTGRIWSNTGTQLASVAFSGDTGSGWKTQVLAAPLAIAAGTTYVVSVNAGAYYAFTPGGFSAAISNGGLTAPVGAGIFNETPGVFPAASFGNNNYFRDVVFVAGAAPPLQAPVVSNGSFNLTVPASAGPVGTMSASNSPTSWAITAGNAAGYFSINAAGIVSTSAAIVAGSYSLTVSATNAAGSGTGSATIAANVAGNDGLNGAPAGTPSRPTLLDSYVKKPTWNVPSVHYNVGVDRALYPTDAALKAAATATLPSGCTRNAGAKTINITGSDVLFDGWTFTGGWQLNVNGGSNNLVRNCHFQATTVTPLTIGNGATNTTVKNCNITGTGGTAQMMVGCNGLGTNLIQYCNLDMGWGQNFVFASQVGGENLVFQYNVISNAGWGFSAGAHGDWIQCYNAPNKNTNNFSCKYNLFLQTMPISQGRTQGISAYSANSGPTSGGCQTENFENNVFIGTSGAYVNFALILDRTRLIGSGTVKDNYLDLTGIENAWYIGLQYNGSNGGPYSGPVTVSGNYNMKTGAVIN
jgi:hypothetical protein